MYPIEITNQFIELRSRDISLQRIADQLGINKSTTIDWQRRYQAQIDEFKAIHLDAVRERLTTRYEDELEYAMTELKRIRAELKTRDWDFEPTTFLHHAEAAAYRRVQKLCALADFPRGGRDATAPASASSADGRAMCPPLPRAAETKSLAAHGASLGQGEAQTCMRSFGPHSAASVQSEVQNPSKIQPFAHHPDGGITSPSLEGEAPRRRESESEIPNRQSDIRNQQSQTDCVSAPSRLCVESDPQTNPSKIQPFAHQPAGGITSASLEGEALRRHELESEIPNRQSDILNQQSETHCDSTPSRPCVEVNEPRVETQNPSGIQPLPLQDQGGSSAALAHNPDPTLNPAAPCAQVGRAVPLSHGERDRVRDRLVCVPSESPSAPHTPPNGSADSQIENPNSKIAEPSEAEADFGGESVPINPFESTRQWLESQGIHVSKIPKGARIITAG